MSWKKDTVNDLHALLTSGETLAVIDIHGVPASAMFGMRAELRGQMKIQVAKKRLMKIAWERAGFDFADLEKLYESAVQPALVSTSNLKGYMSIYLRSMPGTFSSLYATVKSQLACSPRRKSSKTMAWTNG